MLPLEQNIIKKNYVDKNATKLDADNDSRKYKIEVIQNSVIYTRESKLGHLQQFHNLVF